MSELPDIQAFFQEEVPCRTCGRLTQRIMLNSAQDCAICGPTQWEKYAALNLDERIRVVMTGWWDD